MPWPMNKAQPQPRHSSADSMQRGQYETVALICSLKGGLVNERRLEEMAELTAHAVLHICEQVSQVKAETSGALNMQAGAYAQACHETALLWLRKRAWHDVRGMNVSCNKHACGGWLHKLIFTHAEPCGHAAQWNLGVRLLAAAGQGGALAACLRHPEVWCNGHGRVRARGV